VGWNGDLIAQGCGPAFEQQPFLLSCLCVVSSSSHCSRAVCLIWCPSNIQTSVMRSYSISESKWKCWPRPGLQLFRTRKMRKNMSFVWYNWGRSVQDSMIWLQGKFKIFRVTKKINMGAIPCPNLHWNCTQRNVWFYVRGVFEQRVRWSSNGEVPHSHADRGSLNRPCSVVSGGLQNPRRHRGMNP